MEATLDMAITLTLETVESFTIVHLVLAGRNMVSAITKYVLGNLCLTLFQIGVSGTGTTLARYSGEAVIIFMLLLQKQVRYFVSMCL